MKTSASYLEPQASHTLILIFALLLALVSQKKATADLVRAAEKGDLATVQDCLSKKANIETQPVRCMLTCCAVVSCRTFSFINI